jgi:hypothetical protein
LNLNHFALCLPNSWDYRHEPPSSALVFSPVTRLQGLQGSSKEVHPSSLWGWGVCRKMTGKQTNRKEDQVGPRVCSPIHTGLNTVNNLHTSLESAGDTCGAVPGREGSQTEGKLTCSSVRTVKLPSSGCQCILPLVCETPSPH